MTSEATDSGFVSGAPPERLIAYQGEPGSNSDAACRSAFAAMSPLPCTTFEDALAAVAAGAAALAMIPIENSIAGRVADIHHLLPKSGLHIVGEHFMPIHFQLMAAPGASLDSIKTVRSHVHALGQCRRLLREHAWRAVVADDTAGAAREVAAAADPTQAALAPRAAADLYGLTILAEDVEDRHDNTTRFVVLSKDAHVPPAGGGPVITSFVFRVRNVPAALYKALGGFATNGVNMTKLESYQPDGSFRATEFYAEVQAHPQDAAMQRALDELSFFTSEVTLLGTYPASGSRSLS